jgi:superfamily II DNA or RNA helicase
MISLGSIVRFRKRDWVLIGEDHETIFLRPLTGTSDDLVALHRKLADLLRFSFPDEGLRPSQFPLPAPDSVADAQSVHLLWQAARLLLREGAAPFRSLGRISVRPRTYQLVPLMMALRLDPVRLLIADDVGVGKSIEAGLIVRELWDRGEVSRFAVLCPPYLCDQWAKELREKFHFEAVVINPATIGQLERRTPPGRTIYEYNPVQVISIDFIKQERNKSIFLLYAPELLIVDEAHSVTPGPGQNRHLRYDLVRKLARNQKRHLLLLTATPHSGIAESFQKLLGLLNPVFEDGEFTSLETEKRVQLARHFVQRTRSDITSRWEAETCFPRRETLDVTYTLSSAYRKLFETVYAFCTEIVRSGEQLRDHQRRMRWWGALALLRCVMSSPAAAVQALHKRRTGEPVITDEEDEAADESYRSYAYEPGESVPMDESPAPLLDRTESKLSEAERRRLRELERLAEAIGETEDTKLQSCIALVRKLLEEDHNPVVWCFYVDTAEYVAKKLREALAADNTRVECLTGRIGEEERRERVEQLMSEPGKRVLVATDCLSEGINLQKGFSAVIHYDLPWNPNRLEQREGRVDRFEQVSPIVKAVRYYGRDNPVDGAVIRVLLNKAREIRQTLGTYVPIPEDEERVIEALVHALFFERKQAGKDRQLELAFEDSHGEIQMLHKRWDLDAQREKESRTRFAQHALKPEEVRRELESTDNVLGDPAAVRNFVLSACQRLGVPMQQSRRHSDVWIIMEAPLRDLPEAIRRAIPTDRKNRWMITFTSPTPEGADYVGRNHPFVVALARYLFEQAFANVDEPLASRCGAIRTRAVGRLTALLLLRPRFQIMRPDQAPLLAEEVFVVGWQAYSDSWVTAEEALTLLAAEPSSNLPLKEKRELVASMLDEIKRMLADEQASHLGKILRHRASEVEAAHRRIRQSLDQRVRGLRVELHWPPDLLGLLVLQPEIKP